MKRDQTLGQMTEHLTMMAIGAALAAMGVPTAVVGLSDFQANIGLDDAGDGGQLVAQAAVAGIRRRLKCRRLFPGP